MEDTLNELDNATQTCRFSKYNHWSCDINNNDVLELFVIELSPDKYDIKQFILQLMVNWINKIVNLFLKINPV